MIGLNEQMYRLGMANTVYWGMIVIKEGDF